MCYKVKSIVRIISSLVPSRSWKEKSEQAGTVYISCRHFFFMGRYIHVLIHCLFLISGHLYLYSLFVLVTFQYVDYVSINEFSCFLIS